MLKACKYCGKIHNTKYVCEKKPTYRETPTDEIHKFRCSQAWVEKRDYIKKMDKYLCQACLHNFYGTMQQLNTVGLEVHHIIPIRKAWDLKLSDNNLITLCRYHHELAERGAISVNSLLKITQCRQK